MSEEKKEEVKEVTTNKKTTWLNRIGSAIVGALVAIGSMFGITQEQIAEQKAKVESMKTLASEALTAIKSGDVTVATAKLQEAVATGKEVVASAKEVIEKVKAADAKSVVEQAKNAAAETMVKAEVKKTEEATKKVESEKKAEADKKVATAEKTENKNVEVKKEEVKK